MHAAGVTGFFLTVCGCPALGAGSLVLQLQRPAFRCASTGASPHVRTFTTRPRHAKQVVQAMHAPRSYFNILSGLSGAITLQMERQVLLGASLGVARKHFHVSKQYISIRANTCACEKYKLSTVLPRLFKVRTSNYFGEPSFFKFYL
jgi:hypothetical protein